MEDHRLVDAVEEFGPELGSKRAVHGLFDRVVPQRRDIEDRLAAEVGRHQDQRVAEVDGAPERVGQPPVIEHLQQHVEHVGVRFFDLVKEHDRVRTAPDRLGQLPALFVTDIPGGRADQPGDRVLLHVLAAVDPDHRAFVVEQQRRERLDELRLADTCGPQEDERAERSIRIGQA